MLTGVSPKIPSWRGLLVPPGGCSVTSGPVGVLGTATSIPDCSTGAVIMKITSSTSTTSTSGVTLISASEVRVWPLLLVKAMFRLASCFRARGDRPLRQAYPHRNLFQRIQQLAGKVVYRRGKSLDARRELVVSNHRGHGHKKPGCRDRKAQV